MDEKEVYELVEKLHQFEKDIENMKKEQDEILKLIEELLAK